MTAKVEGEKARTLAGQACRHVDLVGVGGEMDEGPLLEPEDSSGGVAILLVLSDGAAPILAGHRILEFAGCDRHAIEREQQVDFVALTGMASRLACDRQFIERELRDGLRVKAMSRLKPS